MYLQLTADFFIPFPEEIYAMAAVLVGAYGIINQYGPKMPGGSIGRFFLSTYIVSTIARDKKKAA